jgi:nitroreductase
VDALTALMTRRSIRTFTDEPVTDEEIETVLRAAMAAPSAHNMRQWRFVVVRDPQTLNRLSKATLFAGPIGRAQAGIVVCSEKRVDPYAGFWAINCAAAIENALLAAHAIGLGAVWIGVHPISPFALAVRRVIGAPRDVAIHSMIAVGRPAEPKPPVDRFEADWVHRERW